MPFVRLALRDCAAEVVARTAALLGTIDQRWCHRELVAALQEFSGDRRRTTAAHYVSAALRHSDFEIARRRGRALEPAVPRRSIDAAAFLLDEASGHDADREFARWVGGLVDIAAQLRCRLPDDLMA